MVKWQEGLLYEMKAHMKYYFMADKNGKILWREEPIKEDTKRELERIYYETHKKVYEKEHRQATGEEIVLTILAKLPELGFVRLEDVEIEQRELFKLLLEIAPSGVSRDECWDLARVIFGQSKRILKMKEEK